MTETLEVLLPLEQIKVGDRYRKDVGDLAGLAKSIADVGLLNPIVLTSEYVLVAGLRRMEAVKTLGWKTVPVRVLDLDELLLRAEHDENVVRKDFTITERAALAEALEKREKELAQQRQKEGAKRGGQRQGSSQVGGSKKAGEAKTVAAKAAGTSATTQEKVMTVIKAAAEEPERFAGLPA